MDKAYPTSSLIPSENELAKEFQVTRATIRNAINELKKEGLIYTEKGRGSFVSPPKIEQSLLQFYSFGRTYKDSNQTTTTKLISIDQMSADKDLAIQLRILINEPLFVITRLRIFNGFPLILETSYVPLELMPDLTTKDLNHLSLFDLYETDYNLKIVNAKEFIEPKLAGEQEAYYLDIQVGSPVFYTERTTYTLMERPIEIRKSFIRGDKFRFYTEFN